MAVSFDGGATTLNFAEGALPASRRGRARPAPRRAPTQSGEPLVCDQTALLLRAAALLIQGSACVYSKKVEYLYSLLYQTLNVLIQKR